MYFNVQGGLVILVFHLCHWYLVLHYFLLVQAVRQPHDLLDHLGDQEALALLLNPVSSKN